MPRSHQRRSIWKLAVPLLLLGLLMGGGCTDLRDNVGDWLRRTFGSPTPREVYDAGLRRVGSVSPERIGAWRAAYADAFADSLYVSLPHREVVGLDTTIGGSVLTYRFYLPAGRRLRVLLDDITGTIFPELHRADAEPGRPIVAADTSANGFTYEVTEGLGSNLLLLIQPAIDARVSFELTLLTVPAVRFPVAGKDESAIKSFWGAPRDGGRRRHEGNDIFADRGTPVVAVTDGRVRSVREGGLGGKSVWLADGGGRGVSYYYAHLDRQLVERGQYVRAGDTLGLVGNTGNARTTPPHLHFGIYARGARDPFPYLRGSDETPPPPSVAPLPERRVPARGLHFLRRTPERDEEFVIRRLSVGEAFRTLARSGRYYRIVLEGGETGYVNFD